MTERDLCYALEIYLLQVKSESLIFSLCFVLDFVFIFVILPIEYVDMKTSAKGWNEIYLCSKRQ